MKRAIYCATMFSLLAATTLASSQSHATPSRAQQSSSTTSAKAIELSAPGAACPVGMRALQGAGYGLVHVRGAEQPDVPGQRVHLIITNGVRGTARNAQVLVRGLSPKNRARDVSGLDQIPDTSKTMGVTFQPEDATSVAADLVLPGFTSVSSVELQSITYQDGSTWNIARDEACRVAPDPMMLITER
jgi:hypothetical protein